MSVYSEHVDGRDKIVAPPPVSLETGVTGKGKQYVVRDEVIKQALLRVIEAYVCPPLLVYTRAKIGGKSFTAGEPIHGVR